MDRYNNAVHAVTHHAGSRKALVGTVVAVVLWLIAGAVTGFSRGWELTVTCGVPVLTLFMVIVLQHAQNRDSKATHLKLNELLLTLEEPNSEIIRARRLPDEELDRLDRGYDREAQRS